MNFSDPNNHISIDIKKTFAICWAVIYEIMCPLRFSIIVIKCNVMYICLQFYVDFFYCLLFTVYCFTE